jgi:hypothetical protein
MANRESNKNGKNRRRRSGSRPVIDVLGWARLGDDYKPTAYILLHIYVHIITPCSIFFPHNNFGHRFNHYCKKLYIKIYIIENFI